MHSFGRGALKKHTQKDTKHVAGAYRGTRLDQVTGSSHGIKSRDQVTGSSHGIKSRDQVTGSSNGIKSRDQVTGSSHGIKSRVQVTGSSHLCWSADRGAAEFEVHQSSDGYL
jgi:hypothetical protein